MKKTSKYLALSLAACISLSPVMLSAENLEGRDSVPVPIMEEIQDKDYLNYEGKIVDIIDRANNRSSILVKAEGDDYGLIFHLGEEVILLGHKSKDFIKAEDLKVGSRLDVFYKKNTPMALSLPGQLTPDVIILKDGEDLSFIKLGAFNRELISRENDLKLNISEDTSLVNKKGEKLDKEDLKNKDLIVFYTITTRSIPPQTNPEKVIVIGENKDLEMGAEVSVLDKIFINDNEIKLVNPIYTGEDGIKMLPLREIGEALGYKVEWDGGEKAIDLTKGPQWTRVTIGQDKYNFAKMLITLGKPADLKDSKTYVPFNFLDQVLKMEIRVFNGILSIES